MLSKSQFIFLVNNINATELKDYIFKAFASSKLGTIKISENEKFSTYNSKDMWEDSEGDYGTEYCSGYVKEFNKTVEEKLEIASGTNFLMEK